MRCEGRRWRWLAALVLALAAVACGGDGEPGADGASSSDASSGAGSSADTDEADDGGESGEGEPPVADAPSAGFDIEEMCERLADVDLDELFTEELEDADPGTGDDDGCAYASDVTGDDIAPDVDALVTIARTASELDDDTVAGDTGGALPDLERLPALGDQGAIRTFRTQNEYIDTWEAWVFLALDEGLLRIHARDPGWEDRDDALEAVLELLEALDVPTT